MRYICILLIIICGCTRSYKHQQIETIYVDLDHQTNSLRNIPADTLFRSANYIPLETTDSSLLSEISKIIIYNDNYYILDRPYKSLFVFDINGKFVRKLSKIGRGPDEYLSLEDFDILNDTLYVLSSISQKIMIFDLTLHPINEIKTGTFCTNISVVKNRIFVFNNFLADDLKNFYAINKANYNIVEKFVDFPKEKRGVSKTISIFTRYNNELYNILPYDYYIYQIDGTSLLPKLAIDFGEKHMFPSEFKNYPSERQKNYITAHYKDWLEMPVDGIDNLYLSDKYLFFTFVNSIFPYIYLRNNKTADQYWGNLHGTVNYPLANNRFCFINDTTYICLNSAENVIGHIERGNKLPEHLYKLKIDDNPVLAVFKFK